MSSFTLVLGGAASGKSAFAESLCFQSDKPRVYIATAQAFDDEMREKIFLHRKQRGSDWLTIDAPTDVAGPLVDRSKDEIVLLDCATMWLSNLLMADLDIEAEGKQLINALQNCPADVIVVSNEVGHGIVPENALARAFRGAQGRLNQQLAAAADTVYFVTAGLPQCLKGKDR